MEDRSPLVEVTGLEVRFKLRGRAITPVNGVSFQLQRGERLAVVGESGSGKSMMALAIMGLIPPPGKLIEGDIRIDGRSVVGLSPAAWCRIRGQELAMIFQDPLTALNPVHTIGKQLTEAIRLHQSISAGSARSHAVELLDRVHIPAAKDRLRDYPHQFSGGMRQRVMIAMALANKPSVIIADEPTTALDVTTQAQILSLLDEVCAEEGASCILISHDLGVVGSFCDRIAVMYAGNLVELGSAQAVFEGSRHPYTIGLLASTPPLGENVAALFPIPGEPPELSRLGDGCAFAPRCPFRRNRCLGERPELRELGPGQRSACHYAEQVAGDS